MVSVIWRGWRDSISLLAPKELSLLFLVSLKTLVRSFSQVMLYFWWLVIAAAYMSIVASEGGIYSAYWHHSIPAVVGDYFDYIYVTLLFLLSYYSVLAVRSSLEKKNSMYYLSYTPRALIGALFYFSLPDVFLVPILWFSLFFFLDEKFSAKSLVYSLCNGFILWVCYVPFLLFIGGWHMAVFVGYQYIAQYIQLSFFSIGALSVIFILGYLIWLYFISLMSGFYIKIRHAQQKLFFTLKRRNRGGRPRGSGTRTRRTSNTSRKTSTNSRSTSRSTTSRSSSSNTERGKRPMSRTRRRTKKTDAGKTDKKA